MSTLKSDHDDVVLKAFRSEINRIIHQEYMDDYPLEIIIKREEKALRGMLLKIKYEVPGLQLESTYLKWPLNWKEAVKERFAPAWLLKRWPVRYKTFQIDPVALYPQIKLDRKQYPPTMRVFVKEGVDPECRS